MLRDRRGVLIRLDRECAYFFLPLFVFPSKSYYLKRLKQTSNKMITSAGRRNFSKIYKNYINGKWVESRATQRFDVKCPLT